MTPPLIRRIRFRIALWCEAKLLPFRVSPSRPLSWIESFANRSAGVRYPDLPPDYILNHVLKVTRRPYVMRDRRCLRQGLLAYRFLRAAGYEIELHFGIDQADSRGQDLSAHCWIVHDGRVLLNPPPADMPVIFILRSDGRELPVRNAA